MWREAAAEFFFFLAGWTFYNFRVLRCSEGVREFGEMGKQLGFSWALSNLKGFVPWESGRECSNVRRDLIK